MKRIVKKRMDSDITVREEVGCKVKKRINGMRKNGFTAWLVYRRNI
jgi:hypothetical protein